MKKPLETHHTELRMSEIMEDPCKVENATVRVDISGLMLQGKCPYCGRKIKHWESPSGRFAPEVWSALRRHGIDPATGHSLLCKAKDLKL